MLELGANEKIISLTRTLYGHGARGTGHGAGSSIPACELMGVLVCVWNEELELSSIRARERNEKGKGRREKGEGRSSL